MGVDSAATTAIEQHELIAKINKDSTTRPRRAVSKRKIVELVLDDDEDEEETYEPVKKRTRKTTLATKSKVTNVTDAPSTSTKKSSATKGRSISKQLLANVDDKDDEAPAKPAKRAKKKSASTTTGEERRLKRFRDKAPKAWQDLYDRAVTQRMFVLDRSQTAAAELPPVQVEAGFDPVVISPEHAPSATVVMAGTTGNIYTCVSVAGCEYTWLEVADRTCSVHITHVPTCTCPAYQKSQQPCKHVIYVLHQVLKAPANLVYQLAFVTTELIEIFQHAPPLPSVASGTLGSTMDGNRKPIEDDCPICCCELDAASEEIVYCRAACGNNLHKTCFDQWAGSKRSSGTTVTCPFCRTPWQAGDVSELAKYATVAVGGPKVNADGYVNIAQELGISGKRDYSSVSLACLL